MTLLERKQMGSKDNVDEHTLKSIVSTVIHGKQLSGLPSHKGDFRDHPLVKEATP